MIDHRVEPYQAAEAHPSSSSGHNINAPASAVRHEAISDRVTRSQTVRMQERSPSRSKVPAAKRARYSTLSLHPTDMDQREIQLSQAYDALPTLDGDERQAAIMNLAENVYAAKSENVGTWTRKTLKAISSLPVSRQVQPTIAVLQNIRTAYSRDDIAKSLTTAIDLIKNFDGQETAQALSAYIPHISKCPAPVAERLFEQAFQNVHALAAQSISERAAPLAKLASTVHIYEDPKRQQKLDAIRAEIASLPPLQRALPLESVVSAVGALPSKLRAGDLERSLRMIDDLPKPFQAAPLDEAATAVWFLPDTDRDLVRVMIRNMAQGLPAERKQEILESVG